MAKEKVYKIVFEVKPAPDMELVDEQGPIEVITALPIDQLLENIEIAVTSSNWEVVKKGAKDGT